MALCIRQRIFSWKETYDVTDENQKVKYFVEGQFFSLGHKIHIYDDKHQEVAFIKVHVWTLFFKKFDIIIHGEQKGMIQEKLSFFHPHYQVDFNGWDIVGNMMEWDYTIRQQDFLIATISRKIFSWANVFYIDTPNPDNELLVLALALAVDAAHTDNEQASYAAMSSYH
jgi:uncharacterized protein YxjI